MTLDPLPTYSTARSYVLKLRRETAHGRTISGRLENLATGDRHDFDSGEHLLALLGHLVIELEKHHE